MVQVVMKVILCLVVLVLCFTAVKAEGTLCTPDISRTKYSRTFGAISGSITKIIETDFPGSVAAFFFVKPTSAKDLYMTAAHKYHRPTSTEGYLDFMEIIQNMSTNAIEFCNSPGNILDTVKHQLLKNFTTAITKGNIGIAVETFGKLSCANVSRFYDALNATQLEQLIFPYDPSSPPPTLAFVVDDTGSMHDEIEAVKDIIFSFIKTEKYEPIAYILGTFNDPLEENTPAIRYNAKNITELHKLKEAVNSLHPHGGGDCNEYGMHAILDALSLAENDSNIVVLTDAPAKDFELTNDVIDLAREKGNPVHFLISPSFCNHNLVHESSYSTVAAKTCGVVMNSTFDLKIVSEFAKNVKKSLTDCTGERKKRAGTPCKLFFSSAFTASIHILFLQFDDSVKIKSPTGSSIFHASPTGSYATFNYSDPSPGQYKVCSAGHIHYILVLKSNLDFAVEYHSDSTSHLTAGSTKKVIVSSTQLDKINMNKGVHLSLISKHGKELSNEQLSVCNGLLVGIISIPHAPYHYRLEGYDYNGIKFSQTKSKLNTPMPPPLHRTTVTHAAISTTTAPTSTTCPCINGGSCITYRRFGRERVRCECAAGYRGSRCQETIAS